MRIADALKGNTGHKEGNTHTKKNPNSAIMPDLTTINKTKKRISPSPFGLSDLVRKEKK